MQRILVLSCAMLIVTGCGAGPSAGPARMLPAANNLKQLGMAAFSAQDAGGGRSAIPSVNVQRRVIYDAQVTLIVKEFSAIETEIPKLVKQFGGYLADASVDRTQGQQRSGRWQARIPVDQFDLFLDALRGEVSFQRPIDASMNHAAGL